MTSVAAAMGSWKDRDMKEVTYLAPYWLPRGFWLPFETMGPFRGALQVLRLSLAADMLY